MPVDLSVINLSAKDIIFAAVLAFILTWLIQSFSKIIKLVVSMPSELTYSSSDFALIMQKCCSLFPHEIVQFNGQTLKRGMIVRVTTNKQKVFEGKLIGLNKDNVVCVLTPRYVVAHGLESITEIFVVKVEE